MKRIVAFAALLTAAPLLAWPSSPMPVRDTSGSYNSPASSAFPPPRFHAMEAGIPVLFVNDVTRFCGGAPPGYRVIACVRTTETGVRVMVLPNPCDPAFRFQTYAHIACHERAHVNGWSRMHEE